MPSNIPARTHIDFLHRWFVLTVDALVACLLLSTGVPISANTINTVTKFINRQHARMPVYLRLPLLSLTLLFDLWPLLLGGRQLFHQLGQLARRRQVAAWKSSQLSFRRDLLRFYASLAIFGLFSTSDEVRSLEPSHTSS